MFYKLLTICILGTYFLSACSEEKLTSDFNVSLPSTVEPDSLYCAYESFIQLEEAELGKIKSFTLYGKSLIIVHFTNLTDKVFLNYNHPLGLKGLAVDTVINIKSSDEFSVKFEFGNYGNKKKYAIDGNLYIKRISSDRLSISWCNLRIPKYKGHTLGSQGNVLLPL